MQIEKWYIKRDKSNYIEINNWFNNTLQISNQFDSSCGILNYPQVYENHSFSYGQYGAGNFTNLQKLGYVEIDTGYFRQHILQIPSEDSKEIINNSYSIF